MIFRADDVRGPGQRAAALAKQARGLVRLPPRVALFYLRALVTAYRAGDRWSLDVVTRPHELAALLRVARGRRHVVEIGTATAWTSTALALADPARRVVSVDVTEHDHRDRYLALAPSSCRERIDLRLITEDDAVPGVEDVDLLFVDGAHDAESTVRAYEAWAPRLTPDALVLFHDYGDPAYPGVAAAVERLGLPGRPHGRMFVSG